MSAELPPLRSQPNPPLYRDVKTLRWVGQVTVLAVVLVVLWWLFDNAVTNLQNRGLPTGFRFLQGRAGFAIPGVEGSANLDALGAFNRGFTNTLRVIMVGIPACTIIGILIGVARLSENAAVRAVGTLYVETFRNIPVLLWIFFATTVFLVETLPPITEEVTPFGAFVVSNRGIGIPWLNPDADRVVFVLGLLAALLVTIVVVKWRGRVNARTGRPSRGGLYGTLAFLLAAVVANVVSGNALALDLPSVQGRMVGGGMTVAVPYAGLTVGLTLYTASHVAEIVRGAIQAVPKGQTEASQAIALSTYQRYRFVVLPQAFRIMIPPLSSQYLNLTKNSSLGVAVSYVELTSIFQRLSNNAAPALQVVIILMGFYLVFSLGISLVANIINRRLMLEGRS